MSKKQEFENLLDSFIRLSNEFNAAQKLLVTFPDNTTLSTKTAHLVETIDKYPNSNTTDLAKILGITKGAISQQTLRLEKMKIITEHKAFKNKKEKFFSLTKKGKKLSHLHEQLHVRFYQSIADKLGNFSQPSLELIQQIFEEISQNILEYQKELQHKE